MGSKDSREKDQNSNMEVLEASQSDNDDSESIMITCKEDRTITEASQSSDEPESPEKSSFHNLVKMIDGEVKKEDKWTRDTVSIIYPSIDFYFTGRIPHQVGQEVQSG